MPNLETIIGHTESKYPGKPTPSGIYIDFQSEPERLYRVNGVEVPSVTTVLGVLHKPALIWWGMKVGVDGLVQLQNGGNLLGEMGPWNQHGTDWCVEKLKQHKLTVNHVRDKAGSRGTSVHNAFERYCLTGHKPIPEEFPEEERGYVEGLLKFIWAVNPEPIECEVMVGSAEKGFAGRFDLLASTEEKLVNPTPRKKRDIPSGRGIWDLKTGKGIYDTHHLQTAAYRFAMEESHGIRSDYEAIVNVREDGSWDVGVSDKIPTDFLAIKGAYDVLRK